MDKLDGGRLVVKALKKEGVEHLFTLSGGHLMPIFDACLDEGIRLIDTRHEQAAAHMAEGWSLITRKMGVCAVTAGPGLTDAVTAVANAYQSNTPMLILGGRSSLKENDIGTLQDIDQMSLMRPITKWARICHHTHRIPFYIATAYRQALSGRPGPVYLELPMDILFAKVEESKVEFPERYRTEAKPAGDPALVAEACALLARAERPLILAGTGSYWSRAEEAIKAFAEKTHIPVITRTGGRGILPDSHPLALSGSMLELLPTLMTADAVLALGTRFNFMLLYGRIFQPHVKVIQVDIEPSEIGLNRGPDIGIFGDVRLVLEEMRKSREKIDGSAWAEQARTMVSENSKSNRSEYDLKGTPIHPRRLVEEIRDLVGGKAVYICDGGDIMLWGSEVFPAERPGSVIATGPLGCLGVGLPFALAAKLAQPDRTVVLLSGDGTFGLNGMEFDTAVRHKIPVLCVIGNDQAWGMIKHGQELMFGFDRACACELGPVRYDQMVAALGGHGEFVEKPEDIRPALERALKSGKPACVNVLVDPRYPHPVSKMAAESGVF
ncbi:MAG: thiamine pyrophosphate-binding protein [bacterium]|nr:thiamine pyrophosphate-binding protein [bacterium]